MIEWLLYFQFPSQKYDVHLYPFSVAILTARHGSARS